MWPIVEKAAKDNGLVTAFAVVGLLMLPSLLDRDLLILPALAATLAGLGLTETSTNGGTLTGAAASFVKDLNVTTAEGAQKAMSIVDKALESVNSVRDDLGAIQNRFTSVVANLQTSSENLSASRSRIHNSTQRHGRLRHAPRWFIVSTRRGRKLLFCHASGVHKVP